MCIITTTPIQHLFFQVKTHPPQIQFSLTYLGDNPEYPQPASISGSNIVFANGSEYYLGIRTSRTILLMQMFKISVIGA